LTFLTPSKYSLSSTTTIFYLFKHKEKQKFVKGSVEANQKKARNKERNKILQRKKERTTGT
jgi:hypothetical protein